MERSERDAVLRGLRNIAAHHYEAIRLPNIWLTIQRDVPELKRMLLEHPVES